MLGLDLYKLCKGVLQAPGDGNGSPHGHIEIRELFVSKGACRVDGGAAFIDDRILNVYALISDKIRHELLALARSRAVSDGDDMDSVSSNQGAKNPDAPVDVFTRLLGNTVA